VWWLRQAKWWLYMRSLAESAEQWIVPGGADRDSLDRQLGHSANITIIPNGVDTNQLAYTPPTDAAPQLVFCGAMSYQPNRTGLAYFCKAIWPIILEQVPTAQLVVTGDCRQAPAQVLHAPRVTLLGHVANLQPIVQSSQVSIVPLQLGVGTRLKIVESMALGTPVVSTSLGAEGLAVTNEQTILIGDNAEHFAAQVVRLLQDSKLRQRISQAGRQLAEQRYAWPVLTTQLSECLIQAVLAYQQRQMPHGQPVLQNGGNR
jgi:polysaccharide biosynthesis protein PslH